MQALNAATRSLSCAFPEPVVVLLTCARHVAQAFSIAVCSVCAVAEPINDGANRAAAITSIRVRVMMTSMHFMGSMGSLRA